MRTIVFLEQYANLSGGQRVLLTLVDGLRQEFRCRVVVPARGPLTEELKLRAVAYDIVPLGYYSLGGKKVGDIARYVARLPYLVMRLRRILRAVKPDLVYANAARTFPWATLACASLSIPLVWHVHSIFDRGLARRLCLYFGRNAWVRKIIAVSQAAAEPLAGLGDKVEVMYNAVDTAVYFPGDRRGPVRQEFGLGDAPVIAMAGLLVAWKGVDDAIRAMRIVRERFPRAKLFVIGDVLYARRGQVYKRYLKRLVAEQCLTDAVVFAGFRSDVPALLREVEVLVLASRQPDPCPTVLLQAMASGAAVIATDFGGPAEIIDDAQDGLLYPAGDIEALARRIEFLLERPQERERIAAAARQKMQDSFNQSAFLSAVRSRIVAALVPAAPTRYQSGVYQNYNPTWHAEDAGWKTREIEKALPPHFVTSLPATVRLADIGCGVGIILRHVGAYLQNQGKTVISSGYDLSAEVLAQARRQVPGAVFYCQEFDRKAHSSGAGRITIALLIDILEHIVDPAALLAEVGTVSDYIICHLPLEDNLEVNCRGLKRRFTQRVGHVGFYTTKSALALFRKAGLAVEHLHMTCSDCSADYTLASPLRRWLGQPVRKFFFRRWPAFTAAVLGNCSLLVRLRSGPPVPEQDQGAVGNDG